ncbi:MAG: hypothetical protein IPM46_03825 [Flavobacteriales bacterium]|nr:hypothetical protein [Flavobacteriales bacterium]
MRSALLLSACLLLVPLLRAQNLVPNWSFEEISECPDELGQVERATGWLIFRGDDSCDLFHTCGDPPLTSVPGNVFGHQWPASGNAYAAIITYSASEPWPYVLREYFGTELSEPLVVGQQYHATFKVSRAPENSFSFSPGGSRYACNNLGLLFSSAYFFQYDLEPAPGYAHVRAQQIVEDSLNWTLISGSFVADSAYLYVVVGNFFNDEETDGTVANPDGYWNLAYYYVDEVCVSPDPLYCALLSGVYEASASPYRAWQSADGALQVAGLLGSGVEQIQVLDAVGRVVARQQVRGADTWSIGTQGWAQGVYVVVAERQDGGRLAERVFLGR